MWISLNYYIFQKVVFNTYLRTASKQIKLNCCQENVYKYKLEKIYYLTYE